jgi:pimeloyl-ACP methyl ester carboxylesterase
VRPSDGDHLRVTSGAGRRHRSRWVRGLAIGALATVVVLATGFRPDRDPATLEARYATPPSRFVEVDGLRVHYRDRGAGPTVLLVHGGSASLFGWEGWAALLALHHRVITLDMPGHGLTGPDPKARYAPAEMAEFLDAFASAIGLGRFTIGGQSMGGDVAWHYAIQHPERVERLILVDANGLPRLEPRPIGSRIRASSVLGPVVRWVTPRFLVASALRNTYGDPSRLTEAVVDRDYELMLRDGNREATRTRFAEGEDGMDARLGEIHVPTLVLWGDRDQVILPKYGEEFRARIPGAELFLLRGLGHMSMEEDPVASVAPVLRLLDR